MPHSLNLDRYSAQVFSPLDLSIWDFQNFHGEIFIVNRITAFILKILMTFNNLGI